MRRPVRRRAATMVLFVLILLTGCVHGDYHISVNPDGSGLYRLKVLTQPLLLRELDPLRAQIKKSGYQIRKTEEGDQIGWIAEKQVDNVVEEPPGEDLKKALTPAGKSAGLIPLPEERTTGPVQVNKSWFFYRITLDTEADLTQLKADNPLEQVWVDELDLNLKLSLPIKTDQHNADRLSQNGKTLGWHLKPGTTNPIYVEIEFPNPVGWGITGTGILVMALLLWRYRRSRAKGS
ncbi:DUF3153 domain-containing protein [Melghirimyces thermohalophilus]|nr:DUF3153 domain-containing protein [Melghirimyces thermohalophilus]